MLELSEETEALARRLAEQRKTTVEDVVATALKRQVGSPRVTVSATPGRVSDEEIARRRAAIRDIQAQFAKLPVLDPRPIQEIVYEINEL